MVGNLAEETLFIGERGRDAGVYQVIGSASPRALPYAATVADQVL